MRVLTWNLFHGRAVPDRRGSLLDEFAPLLEEGDMVRTELTPQMNGYWLQICRSAVVGRASDAQRRSFDLFNEAVEAGLSVVRPGVTAHEVAVAETSVDGFRLTVSGDRCPPPERAPREAELRLRCLERLRVDGLLPAPE